MSRWLVVAGIVFASGVCGGSPVRAQGPAPAGLRPVAGAPVRSTDSRRSDLAMPARRSGMSPFARDSVAPSHWQEGMLIGALIGAGVGALLVEIGNGVADTPQGGSGSVILVSAALFAVIGGLIGSGSHKT